MAGWSKSSNTAIDGVGFKIIIGELRERPLFEKASLKYIRAKAGKTLQNFFILNNLKIKL